MASAIIVFSHRRWDFVFGRVQHLMSHLAAHHSIVFVEEPVHHADNSFFNTYSPLPNVLVCRLHTPADAPGFHDDHLPYLQKLLRPLMCDYDERIAWFHTPMALPLLQDMHPRLVVYDCTGEPAEFGNASKPLAQREGALLKLADIVLTSGWSSYRAKRLRHPNVHFVPNSVDPGHFLPSLDRVNSHPAHKDIPGPRLGFYGAIDKRIDARLIGELADAHAQWQVVLVGPVVGIDPATLPQRANIHYLGQQTYQALPQFLAGWDVCLLPFAMNDATRFINPTKTLEYMAAELPIVSTPVADVAELYGNAVTIAADAPAFIAACEAALLASPEEQDERIGKMRRVLASTSWEATASRVRALLNAALQRRRAAVMPAGIAAGGCPGTKHTLQSEMPRFAKTAIIGAGPAGLSAAFHLGHDAVLLEKNSMVGGWCRSIKDKGFTFDHAGHIMSSDNPYVLEMYELLLGSNIHWQNREAWICRKNVYTRYPFHGALYGLPPEVVKECVLGAIEARFGNTGKPVEANARFGYPLRGGFQVLVSAFVPHIKGTIELNSSVMRISPEQRMIVLHDGRRYQYDNLISTMPLPELVKCIDEEAPEEVRQAAAALRHISLRCVNLGIARENITDKHWIYYPEDTLFHRIFAQGNASPDCNPRGGFGFTCEIAYSPIWKPLPFAGRELIERCIRDCINVGMLREDDKVIAANEIDMPYAYVVYDHARAKNVDIIKSWLAMQDIILAGCYSEWLYYDSDQAFIAGKKAAEMVKWKEVTCAVAGK